VKHRSDPRRRRKWFHVKHRCRDCSPFSGPRAGKRESAKQPHALKNRLCFSMT
jgi:hypothetical protein